MADNRKYRDEEIAEIFELAASAEGAGLLAPEDEAGGLTLGQLQAVGREVGLSAERVAAAAAELDIRSKPRSARTWLGAPVSVGRVVPLPRGASDEEWNALMTEMRGAFGTEGRLKSSGAVRAWAGGGVHVFLEPTDTGHQLRIGADRDPPKGTAAFGGAGLVVGLLLLVSSGLDAATFGTTLELLIPAVVATLGGGAVAGSVLHMRRWASERERQMELVTRKARALLGNPEA